MLTWMLTLIAVAFLFVLYPFVFNDDSSVNKGQRAGENS